jgi:hypothetical protein
VLSTIHFNTLVLLRTGMMWWWEGWELPSRAWSGWVKLRIEGKRGESVPFWKVLKLLCRYIRT